MRVPSSGLCVSQIFSILLCFFLLGSILLHNAENTLLVGKRSIKSGDEGAPPAKKKHPEEDARPRGFDRGLQVSERGGGVVNILACHLSQGPTGIFYIKNDITKTPFLESHFSPSTEINTCKSCPDPYRNRF